MSHRKSSARPRSSPQVREFVGKIKSAALALDDRNRLAGWNRGASQLLGHRAEDLLGQPFEQVIRARDAFGNFYCTRNAALHRMTERHESIHPFSIEIEDVDRIPVPVVVSVQVLPGGNPSAYYLVLRLQPERRRGLAEQIAATLLASSFPTSSEWESSEGAPAGAGELDLTLRQREVLRLLAHGLSMQEVADKLSLSIHTVRNHSRNILERLHAHNQAEAVALAMRKRLI